MGTLTWWPNSGGSVPHLFPYLMELELDAEVLELVALKIKEEFHLYHNREVELHYLVANFCNLIFKLDHLNAKNKLESSIWAYKTQNEVSYSRRLFFPPMEMSSWWVNGGKIFPTSLYN